MQLDTAEMPGDARKVDARHVRGTDRSVGGLDVLDVGEGS